MSTTTGRDAAAQVTSSRTFAVERLDVYTVALEFQGVLSQLFPRRGHADLRNQLERASASVLLNLAEGCGRTAPGDQRRFYAIARGSAMESAAALEVLAARAPIDPSLHRHGRGLLLRVVQMLTKLVLRVQKAS